MLGRVRHEVLTRRGVGDVGRYHERAAAERVDMSCNLREIRFRTRGERDVGARLGQPDGDAAADAEPGSGDDGHAVVDREPVENHCAPPTRRSRWSPGDARPATSGRSRYVRRPGSAAHT